MAFTPASSVQNTNPNVTAVDNSRVASMIAAQWRPGFDVYKYINGDIETTALIDTINIPDAVPVAGIVPSGGQVPKNSLSSQSIQIAQNHYDMQLAVDQVQYNLSPGLIDMLSQMLDSAGTGEFSEKVIELALMQALVANSSRPSIDGLPVFSTVHPINPHNPSQTSSITGLTTQSNLLTSHPLSSSNLSDALTKARQLVYTNGLPIMPPEFTLFVTPANELLARQLVTGQFFGFQNVFASETNVGSTSNPFANSKWTINVEVLNNYPIAAGGLTTDWYIATHVYDPFVVKIGQKPVFVKLTGDTDLNVVNHNEYIASFKTTFAVDILSHLALIKCTA